MGLTIKQLREALEGYQDDTPVKLRAYCCPFFHDMKVDYAFEASLPNGEIDPESLVVLILDEDITVTDKPEIPIHMRIVFSAPVGTYPPLLLGRGNWLINNALVVIETPGWYRYENGSWWPTEAPS